MVLKVRRVLYGCSLSLLLSCATVSGACHAQAAEADWSAVAPIGDGDLSEASGLARSGRDPAVFWTHNDSGHAARLYAIDTRGRLRARVELLVKAIDWEDIAHFERDGEPWLAIADTGDNMSWRGSVQIHLLPEPDFGARSAKPERSLQLRYEDGARDVEAVAIDAASGTVLLLEKRRPDAGIYAADLDGPEQQIARRIGTFSGDALLPPVLVQTVGMRRTDNAATGMDIRGDGRELALVTTRFMLRYARVPGQSWAETLAAAPLIQLRLPRRAGTFEAICYDAGDGLWILPESDRPQLFRLAAAPADQQ